MELTYINKLKARKVALGEDDARDPTSADEKQWRDENKDLFMSLEEKEDNDHGPVVESDELNKDQEFLEEHGINIFRNVYGESVEAIPSSLSLRKRLLKILE